MRDQVLSLALLTSVTVHLGGLLLLPAPGSGLESSASTVEIRFTEPPPPAPSRPAPSPPPPEAVPTPEPEVVPVEPPPPPSPPRDLTPEFSRTAAIPDPTPQAPRDAPTEEFDQQAIASLIEATQQALEREDSAQRYLMLDVRESLRTALASLHPGEADVEATTNQFMFLLGLRIDPEGYIFDISIRFAPGPRLDPRQIEFAVASMSPLAPPPFSLDPPVEIELKVGFLE